MFQEINSRPLCDQCRKARSDFSDYDKKYGHFSNLLPGFSSSVVNIPLEVLIVAEAHGGGREQDFRPKQNRLEDEVSWIGNYYLRAPLQKFHQSQVRELLRILDSENRTWVFTDLIKCFVNQKLKSNRKIAIQYCSKYLKGQIEKLKPKQILILGNTVASEFKIKHPSHGEIFYQSIAESRTKIIFSLFPSRNTADLWISRNQWGPVLESLDSPS